MAIKKADKGILVSVIIPTMNEEKFIGRCIESINKQTVPRENYEIIVSDSSSEDNTVKIVKSCIKKGLADKVVVCKRNGAGYGRNCGAKIAVGKYFVFPDADTVVSKTWIEGVISGLEKGVAATGPVSALEKDSLKRTLGYILWQFMTRVSFFFGKGIIAGHNFGVRKDTFYAAGKWTDKNMTNEDNEFSQRLHKFGRLVYSEKMALKTSTRRLKNIPMIKMFLNGIKFFIFKKSMSWEEWREDY